MIKLKVVEKILGLKNREKSNQNHPQIGIELFPGMPTSKSTNAMRY